MLKKYFKNCQRCIESKSQSDNAEITWCTCSDYLDVHLSNGSVFEDIVLSSCDIMDATCIEDIEMEFCFNVYNKERRHIVIRVGDIVSIVERHIE